MASRSIPACTAICGRTGRRKGWSSPTTVSKSISASRSPAIWGWCQIVAYSSATVVTAIVRGSGSASSMHATSNYIKWRLGAWSDTTGYPKAVGFYEQRLVWANNGTSPNAPAPAFAAAFCGLASTAPIVNSATGDAPSASMPTVFEKRFLMYSGWIMKSRPAMTGICPARPDSCEIWVGTQAFTEINPNAYSNLRWSIDDFTPFIRGVEAPLVFAVHPEVPARTFAEFLTWAAANKGKLSYSSYQPGTPSHFLGYQLNEKFGLDLTHVPYRGSGLQATALVAGHSQFGFAQSRLVVFHAERGVEERRVVGAKGDANPRRDQPVQRMGGAVGVEAEGDIAAEPAAACHER